MVKRDLYRGSTVSIGIMWRVVVIAHGHEPPSREDWDQVCRHIQENCMLVRGQIVMTAGQAPDAAQRKAALDLLPRGYVAPPAAVLTETLMLRGVLTALNWFLDGSHVAFKPSDVSGIADHLKVGEDEARALIEYARGLVPR